MAPKKNKQREQQEQRRASSSARAHQSLLNSATASGGGGAPGFVGFASFAPQPLAQSPVQSIYDGSDQEIALALKMLAKKGAVTKIKALQTFLQTVLPPRAPAALRPMLGHFAQLYAFEMRDQNDYKVRQLLNEVLAALAVKMRPRAFAPHLQRLLPYWYVAMHDVHADVAMLAKRAFSALFPAREEQQKVLETHVVAVMEEFRGFFGKTADTFEGAQLQADEKEERYERCVSAAVLSIDDVVQLCAEQKRTDVLSDEQLSCSVATVVSSDHFMALASASSKHANFSRDVVRRAVYVVLATLCVHAKTVVAAREEAFGKVILDSLQDKCPTNHGAMWNVVIAFLQTFPDIWSSSAGFCKFTVNVVYPRLFAQIRHGFYGSGRSSFPMLLPLLSTVPLSVVVNPSTGQSALYTGVLEQCWKFLDSKSARFCEPPAIAASFECLTGFFSIFLNGNAAVVHLSDQDAESYRSNYVNQFENVFVQSLKKTLSSPEFPEAEVAVFSSCMLKMSSRLRSFSSDSDLVNTLKDNFTAEVHEWTRQAVGAMISEMSFIPSRVTTFIDTVFSVATDTCEELESAQWLLTSKELYGQCVSQMDALMVDPAYSPDKDASIARLLAALNGVCKTHSVDLLLGETDVTVDSHFDVHYRPVLRALAEWKKLDNNAGVVNTMRTALDLTRPFFLAAEGKKQFLLQLFQDCSVQFGDLEEANDIIQYGLQFPVSERGTKLWLSCGSWQHGDESGALVIDQSSWTLKALQAIWQGKLLDEFLMISLKGRLDDLNSDVFDTLLKSCLGGSCNCPVVSPDAVVILCHFVLRNGVDGSDAVVVQILTHLCELFLKLNDELPAELEVVEGQLYTLLFHLSARGSYRSEASALWAQTVRHSLKKWKARSRVETFVNGLARQVNDFLLADLPAGTTAFNSKQFAAYVKSYVLLATDQTFFTVPQLVEKLDAVNLRCLDDSRRTVFHSRVLSALGDVCDAEQVIDALQAYLSAMASDDEGSAVALVAKLVDMDVSHALTWTVFQSNDYMQRGVDLVEAMESHLTLDHLYEALRSSSGVIDKVLANAATYQSKHKRELAEYRNVVFLDNKQDDVANGQDQSLLSSEQHMKLDVMSIEVLSTFSSIAARASFVKELVNRDDDWTVEAAQTIVISLLAAINTDNEDSGEAIAALKEYFALCDRDAVAKPTSVLFEYLRLMSRAIKRAEKEMVASNLVIKEIIHLSSQESIMHRLVEMLLPSSQTVVETHQWIAMTEYVGLLSVYLQDATSAFGETWENLARLIVTHVIAGKSDGAKIVALKIQKRSSVLGTRRIVKGDQEQIVLAYPTELVIARSAFMELVNAMCSANPDALQELAAHYRDAVLSTVFCGLAECVELKASIVTTYVSIASPSQCFQLANLSFSVEKLLARALPTLRATLSSIHDVVHVNRLVLESFGGIDVLASLFNGKQYPLHPLLRVLLYILASYSGALRLHYYDTSAIDVNAEDEVATEAALARVYIPKALRSALRAVFGGKSGEMGPSNIRGRSRKQKMQEREDITGKLLLWDLFLQLFPSSGSKGSGGKEVSATLIASALSSYVARNGMLTNFLNFSSALLSQETQSASKSTPSELQDSLLFTVADLDKCEDDKIWSLDNARVFQLGTRVFFRTVMRLPAMVRSWWNDDCSRATRSWAAKYFEDYITPSVLAAELGLIQKASDNTSFAGETWDDKEMTVKGSRVSREITTTYIKDECALEMVVRVPPSYPLRCVEVECTKRIGISEQRWRRWVLQIIRVTSSRDGSLLDAVLLWKHNVDKEFEGVEPCPICYSILNPKNMGLPSLSCKTCNNKYHNSCLYKWFNQSGKNKCPTCQQPFC
ncbi:unnamed protein product [Hyaloperonospora brassicae]|uniref:E3 ubiquitin-protein ligase listerin n=1 Tax=Hyaloperonospora brassicae TaxID=162125 RepID=A0AAV0UKT4_HYABA|nr:unnamed protein product [Hyaloperonospora brassicae]